jgi:phosphate transport system substrate-binding protein
MKKFFVLCAGLAFLAAACSSGGNEGDQKKSSPSDDKELLGAGSTFAYPIYSKMFSQYNTLTGVKANYQSIGSGGGIKQLFSKTVDFGASDAFLTDERINEAGAPIVQFPTCLGAVVLSYNLPGNIPVKLSPEVIGGIFMGTIKKWNDPKIIQDNPGVTLPAMEIVVVHRSDGSGTTFIFTDYLSKVYPQWKSDVGNGTSVNWPAGIGGKGNEGVAGQIKQLPGSIGYIELIYALNNQMVFADIKNASGAFIKPSLESTKAAATTDIPADSRITVTNSSAAGAYPIASFTWIMVYKDQNYNGRTIGKATELVNMLWWMTHEGQQFCEPLHYASLSPQAVNVSEELIKSINFGGKPLLNTK